MIYLIYFIDGMDEKDQDLEVEDEDLNQDG